MSSNHGASYIEKTRAQVPTPSSIEEYLVDLRYLWTLSLLVPKRWLYAAKMNCIYIKFRNFFTNPQTFKLDRHWLPEKLILMTRDFSKRRSGVADAFFLLQTQAQDTCLSCICKFQCFLSLQFHQSCNISSLYINLLFRIHENAIVQGCLRVLVYSYFNLRCRIKASSLQD